MGGNSGGGPCGRFWCLAADTDDESSDEQLECRSPSPEYFVRNPAADGSWDLSSGTSRAEKRLWKRRLAREAAVILRGESMSGTSLCDLLPTGSQIGRAHV